MILLKTHLYRRKDRNNKISWGVRWKEAATGKWRGRVVGRTKEEALIVEARVRECLLKEQDPLSALLPSTQALSVADIAQAFYGQSVFQLQGASWQKQVKRMIEGKIVPELGHHSFENLSSEMIYGFYLKLLHGQCEHGQIQSRAFEEDAPRSTPGSKGRKKRPRNRRGVRPERPRTHATIHRYHAVLGHLGRAYEIMTGRETNPVKACHDFRKRFPLKASPSRPITFLTRLELESVVDECFRAKRSPLLGPLVQFLADTGLRRSEALRLKWTDLGEEGGWIEVRESKYGKSRRVPLEREAWEALSGLSRKYPFVFTYPGAPTAFGRTPKNRGRRPHPDSFLGPFQLAAKRAGIPRRVDLHTLRHSYGSNKIRAGYGLKKVSLLLGHSSVEFTARVYTHLLDGDLKVRDEYLDTHDARREGGQGQGGTPEGGPGRSLAQEVVTLLLPLIRACIEEALDSRGRGGPQAKSS